MSDRIPARAPVAHAPLIFLIAAAVLLATGILSLPSLLSLFLDGLPAVLLLSACLGPGLRLMSLFRFDALPLRWRLLGGFALGIGATTLLVLILGLLGFLGRGLWLAILTLFAASAVLELFHLRLPTSEEVEDAIDNAVSQPHAESLGRLRYLWFLIVPFAVMAVLAASTAPGFLWSEEGFGYDVLEYHLQLPREYLAAGTIHYTPHNVYGNFPAAVEMLYLLLMVILDQTIDAGSACQFLHLFLAAATVIAAWTVGSDRSPRCGLVCGVTAATLGWPVYLSGLAYVEHGVLFFGIVSAGAILRFLEPPGSSRPQASTTSGQPACSRRCSSWIIFGGICAGFACGCKYTAVPMIVLPLALALVVATAGRPRNPSSQPSKPPSRDTQTPRRNLSPALTVILFALSSLTTFSPWLTKNLAFTGNPVFPLANSFFQAAPPGWSAESQQTWDAGHRPREHESGFLSRATLLWNHIPGDKYQRFGPALFLLAFAGLTSRKNRHAAWFPGIVLFVQILVWMVATHLYARFAVVILIPLILLAGRSLSWSVPGAVTLLILGAGWNAAFLAKLLHAECPAGAPAQWIESGQVPAYEFYAAVNHLDPDSTTLLVGESRAFYFRRPVRYTVVFNHSPFADLLATAASPDELAAALTRDGITHVFINFSELHRLGRTYGLPASLSRDSLDSRLGNSLIVLREFSRPGGGGPWAVLCEVRQSGPS